MLSGEGIIAMRQMLYVSNTPQGIAAPDLDAILDASRRNNAALHVTGMLLHIDGGFLQILEGESEDLRMLYNRIARDTRHYNARILLDHEAPRAFGTWSMGFAHLGPDGKNGAAADDSLFRITSAAIYGRLAQGDNRIVVTMLETFYRVQTGEILTLRKTA